MQLPDGNVLVVGGRTYAATPATRSAASAWSPVTGHWTALPPMSRHLTMPTACMLPSGRVAVVGYEEAAAAPATGASASETRGGPALSGEIFDLAAGRWSALPAMPLPCAAQQLCATATPAAVSVPGGLIVVGCSAPANDSQQQQQLWAQLFDEVSSKWYILPK